MNKEDILRMARRAGNVQCDCCLPYYDDMEEAEMGDFCVRFAALIAAAEREACAKVCDHMASRCNDMRTAALEVAAESIRARQSVI